MRNPKRTNAHHSPRRVPARRAEAVALARTGLGCSRIARKLGIHETTAARYARDAQIPRIQQAFPLTPEIAAFICERYGDGWSTPKIGKALDHASGNVVAKWLRRLGVEMRPNGFHQGDRGLRADYFEDMSTPEKWYMLGLFATDVTIAAGGRIMIRFDARDSDLVDWIRRELRTRAEVRLDPKRGWGARSEIPMMCLAFRSVALVRSLAKFGIVPNKSRRLDAPHVPKAMRRYFLLGFLDGDGSITANRETRVVAWTGSLSMATAARKFLVEDLSLHPTKLDPKGSTFTARYGGVRQVGRILRYLYEGHDLGMRRKRALAMQILAERLGAECGLRWRGAEFCCELGRMGGGAH